MKRLKKTGLLNPLDLIALREMVTETFPAGDWLFTQRQSSCTILDPNGMPLCPPWECVPTDGLVTDVQAEYLVTAANALPRLLDFIADTQAFAKDLDRLLACYRLSKQPPGALLDRIGKARQNVGGR